MKQFCEYFYNSEFAPQRGAYLKGIDNIRNSVLGKLSWIHKSNNKSR